MAASTSSLPSIRPAPSFSEFRFKEIGKEPTLLSRLSSQTDNHQLSPSPMPTPSADYIPLPSDAELDDISASPNPSILTRIVGISFNAQHNIDSSSGLRNDGMEVDTHLESTNHSPSSPEDTSTPRGDTQSTSRSSQNGSPSIMENQAAESSGISATFPRVSESICQLPISSHKNTASPSFDSLSRSLDRESSETLTLQYPSEPPQVQVNPNPDAKDPSFHHSGQFTLLRALHTRLMSNIMDEGGPGGTTAAQALTFAQSVQTRTSEAVSAAQRAHNTIVELLQTIQDASGIILECLKVAEEAKAKATLIVEKLQDGNNRMMMLNEDIEALGVWLREQEGNAVAEKIEQERREVDERTKAAMERAMKVRLNKGKERERSCNILQLTVPHENAIFDESDAVTREWGNLSNVTQHQDGSVSSTPDAPNKPTLLPSSDHQHIAEMSTVAAGLMQLVVQDTERKQQGLRKMTRTKSLEEGTKMIGICQDVDMREAAPVPSSSSTSRARENEGVMAPDNSDLVSSNSRQQLHTGDVVARSAPLSSSDVQQSRVVSSVPPSLSSPPKKPKSSSTPAFIPPQTEAGRSVDINMPYSSLTLARERLEKSVDSPEHTVAVSTQAQAADSLKLQEAGPILNRSTREEGASVPLIAHFSPSPSESSPSAPASPSQTPKLSVFCESSDSGNIPLRLTPPKFPPEVLLSNRQFVMQARGRQWDPELVSSFSKPIQPKTEAIEAQMQHGDRGQKTEAGQLISKEPSSRTHRVKRSPTPELSLKDTQLPSSLPNITDKANPQPSTPVEARANVNVLATKVPFTERVETYRRVSANGAIRSIVVQSDTAGMTELSPVSQCSETVKMAPSSECLAKPATPGPLDNPVAISESVCKQPGYSHAGYRDASPPTNELITNDDASVASSISLDQDSPQPEIVNNTGPVADPSPQPIIGKRGRNSGNLSDIDQPPARRLRHEPDGDSNALDEQDRHWVPPDTHYAPSERDHRDQGSSYVQRSSKPNIESRLQRIRPELQRNDSYHPTYGDEGGSDSGYPYTSNRSYRSRRDRFPPEGDGQRDCDDEGRPALIDRIHNPSALRGISRGTRGRGRGFGRGNAALTERISQSQSLKDRLR